MQSDIKAQPSEGNIYIRKSNPDFLYISRIYLISFAHLSPFRNYSSKFDSTTTEALQQRKYLNGSLHDRHETCTIQTQIGNHGLIISSGMRHNLTPQIMLPGYKLGQTLKWLQIGQNVNVTLLAVV